MPGIESVSAYSSNKPDICTFLCMGTCKRQMTRNPSRSIAYPEHEMLPANQSLTMAQSQKWSLQQLWLICVLTMFTMYSMQVK